MPTNRLPQFKAQHKKTPLALQARDIEIIKKIYEYRFLDTDLLRVLFADQMAALPAHIKKGYTAKDGQQIKGKRTGEAIVRRLGKLFHHGYLDRPKAQIGMRRRYGNSPFVYALAYKGARVLTEEAGIDLSELINWQLKNKEARDPFILHQLMISKFRATLELATKNHPALELDRWESGEQMKTALVSIDISTTTKRKIIKLRLVPDGLCTLRFKDRPEGRSIASFFLEADRSTMSRPRFIKKILAYEKYYLQARHQQDYGLPEFRVLTITISPQRRDNLRETALAYANLHGKSKRRYLFACERDYDPHDPSTLLGNIWYDLKDDTPRSILPEQYSRV